MDNSLLKKCWTEKLLYCLKKKVYNNIDLSYYSLDYFGQGSGS